MNETDESQQPAIMTRPSPWRRGLVWLRVMLGVVLVPLVLVALFGLGMTGREVTAPDWVRARVEALASDSLGGGTIRVGSIGITLDGTMHPQVRLSNLVLRDRNGAVLARLPEARAQVSPRGLVLQREILPQHVVVRGLQINLRRAASGKLAVAFGDEGATIEEAENFVALLESFDNLFERPGLEALRSVDAEGLVVNYADARAGRSWTVDGGSLHLALTGGATRLLGEVSLLSGRSFVTTLALDYASPRGSRAAEVSLKVTDGLAVDLASQSPALSWLAALDAPLSGSLHGSLDDQGALGPVEAQVTLGAGALMPTTEVKPVNFSAAEANFTYDPVKLELRFNKVAVRSDWGRFDGEAQAYLRDMVAGWPSAIEGQIRLNDISANPDDMFDAPVPVNALAVDFRLRPLPFSIEIGALDLDLGAARLSAKGRIAAAPGGWQVALDAEMPSIDTETLLAYWPTLLADKTRVWVASNIHSGFATDLHGGLRIEPGQDPQFGANWDFHSATVQFSKFMPPFAGGEGRATVDGHSMTFYLDDAEIDTPAGDVARLGGSWISVADTRVRPAQAHVHLESHSTITGALSLLDLPPLALATKASLPVDLAQGVAETTADLDFPMKPELQPGEMRYQAQSILTAVSSDLAVKGHRLTADRLDLTSSNRDGLSITGSVLLGDVPFNGSLTRAAGEDPTIPTLISGRMELSQAALDELNIDLPAGTVSGQGSADVALRLVAGNAPEYAVDSDLAGVALRSDAIGWRLAAGEKGILHVQGVLGPQPSVDRIALDAGGLVASGQISLSPDGGMDVAHFDRLRIGGWLDAPVELRGRGRGRTPAIVVQGGQMDLRRAQFGAQDDGQGGPITLALDSLQVTQGIALEHFRGEFDTAGGLSGRFAADVNGDAAVQGTVVPHEGGTAVRVTSDRAGAVLRSAGLMDGARGGEFTLTLTPTGAKGVYDGVMGIRQLRVQKAPALAALLDAVSVIGLLQQLDGQGLAFDTVDALFRITPDEIRISRSSAVGVGLGISMDGIYTLASGNMDFQGVVSPLYLINGIGAVLTRPGEGLLGFNYTLSGPFTAPRVAVNPLSIFTPGMLRDIFRRPAPENPQ